MTNKERIVELLNNYISENKALKEEYKDLEIKISLFNEVLTYLDMNYTNMKEHSLNIDILLNSIYNNNDYSNLFYKYLNQMLNNDVDDMKSFIAKLNLEYKTDLERFKTLDKQIRNNRNRVSSAYRVTLAIKNDTPILESKYDIINVKKIIGYYETKGIIETKEDLLLCNEIEYYNRNLKSTNATEEQNTNDLYNELPNILNGGFEELDTVEIRRSRKETLDKKVAEIKSYIIYEDDVANSLDSYKRFITEDNEFRYVVNEVLKSFIYDMLEYYEIVNDLETYINKPLRKEAITAYYKLLNKYIDIRKYYEEISKLELTEEDITEETLSVKERQLVFTHPTTNPTKSRLIQDMKNVPNEYYDTVLDLLNRFTMGKVGSKEFKSLSNNKKASGYTELRYDQVRIVTKHIKNNIYDIVGVFVKKSDNDMQQYKTMFNRLITDIDTKELEQKELELSKLTMIELENLVKERARKSSR